MRIRDGFTRRPSAAVAALAIVVSFSFQGSRGLFETTEGRYAESALEMVHRGDWLSPTLAGRPHWTKPPLAYWPIAAGVAWLGPSAWGARLGNALVFCLTVAAVAACGAALWGRETALVAGLVYATSPFPVGAAWALSADTLLTLFEIVAAWAYLRARQGGPSARWWIRAMWIAWGLAFLTKGPAGLLPLLAIVVFERFSCRRVPLLDPVGVLAFVLVGLSWYAWEALRNPGLLGYWARDEVLGRTVANRFQRNPQWWKPFALYVPALVAGQGAWLAVGARRFRSARLHDPRVAWASVRAASPPGFLLLWIALPLAVFWISTSRLTFYVLPLYAPIALAVARAAVAGETAARGVGRAMAVARASAIALVLVKGVATYAAQRSAVDMSPLFAAVTETAGRGADVRAFGEEHLFGLQFYLDGRLRRVSADGTEAWADERLSDALAAVRADPDRAHVLVCRDRDADGLALALARSGLASRRAAAPGRTLFVMYRRELAAADAR